MGLGGHLTWTAVARELYKKLNDKNIKILPCEIHGSRITRVIESEIFKNNPYLVTNKEDLKQANQNKVFPLQLNNPDTNYCKFDSPKKCVQRCDKHCIEQICEFYGIENPELRCEIYFSDDELEKINQLTEKLDKDFIVIEPHAKSDYTPNKTYSFQKWQNVANELKKYIQVVQISPPGKKVLDGVVSLVGETTFREATGVIGKSKMFLSTEGGLMHASTAADTTALIVMTGYQSPVLWSYPKNINLYIGSHGPCGLKIPCKECYNDVENHDENEIIQKAKEHLEL
jgi:ADP-heptose:LPS heptosyltransferase